MHAFPHVKSVDQGEHEYALLLFHINFYYYFFYVHCYLLYPEPFYLNGIPEYSGGSMTYRILSRNDSLKAPGENVLYSLEAPGENRSYHLDKVPVAPGENKKVCDNFQSHRDS